TQNISTAQSSQSVTVGLMRLRNGCQNSTNSHLLIMRHISQRPLLHIEPIRLVCSSSSDDPICLFFVLFLSFSLNFNHFQRHNEFNRPTPLVWCSFPSSVLLFSS